MKHYYRSLGVYRPVLFGAGTALTFGKELIRLLFVERTVRGTSNLFRGIRDGRKIAKDRHVAADAAAGEPRRLSTLRSDAAGSRAPGSSAILLVR